MPYLKITYRSMAIQYNTDISVYLPYELGEIGNESKSAALKVLWIIHPVGEDYMYFYRLHELEDWCREKKIMLVMPTIRCREAIRTVGDYVRFMGEDLPQYLNFSLPLSLKQGDNYLLAIGSGEDFMGKVIEKYGNNFAAFGTADKPENAVNAAGKLFVRGAE